MAETELPAPVAHPSVVARDVHITYKTYGGRRNALGGPDHKPFAKLLGKATQHVAAVSEVHAVRGVSFVAHEGESIGIIGRNGSGKSTLLRAIAGLMPASAGEMYTRGDVALLGVNAALMSSLSGRRNIMLGCLAQGLTRRQVHERYDEIVEFAGIGDFVDLPMKAYSSGMAARLRFAISSAVTPDVLIIDEALATGDAEFREKSTERVSRIREEAGTVFLVSHSISSVRNMCDRAIWLEAGQVMADGPSGAICDQYTAFIEKRRAARKAKD
ncbi:ABC transporter ATP-binding protein [Cellulomonas sp. URHD0024]|uniref:ABC transporter ATP-binding protein n=1 Tax=Cellulomonas sp. URHD0024 TaxID=1302620 RepID=UPI0003FE3DC5|nr:ABC transporter ATP-binding protein [Cellulomonas sp. URHD0024]